MKVGDVYEVTDSFGWWDEHPMMLRVVKTNPDRSITFENWPKNEPSLMNKCRLYKMQLYCFKFKYHPVKDGYRRIK